MTDATPPLIDTPTMVARIRDYGVSTSSQVVTMMMSGAFATSALAIADILRTPDDFWVRFTLWLWMLVTATAAVSRLLNGNSLIVHPSPWHVPVQLSAGFMLCANFALISLSTGGPDGWRYVYLAQFILLIFGYFGVGLMRTNMRVDYFSSELRVAVSKRVNTWAWTQFPRRAQAFMLVYCVLMAAGMMGSWWSKSNPEPWIGVIIGLNVVMTLSAITLFILEIRSFQTLLDDIEAVRVAALHTVPAQSP